MTHFLQISTPRNKKGEKIDSKPTNKKQNNKIGSPLVDYFSRSMRLEFCFTASSRSLFRRYFGLGSLSLTLRPTQNPLDSSLHI